MKARRLLWIVAPVAAAVLYCVSDVPDGDRDESARAERDGGVKRVEREATLVPDRVALSVREEGTSADGAAPPAPQEQIAALLAEPRDLSNPAARTEFVVELQRLEDLDAQQTRAKAEALGLPLLSEHGALLVGFDGEVPRYEISHNAGVAQSIGTDFVRETDPWFPNGDGFAIGLWDVYWGVTRQHNELPRVSLGDDAVEGGLHASHVAGTLAALGLDPEARGMAPQAEIWSFSSTNALSELAANAAQSSTDFSRLFVSLHPYGAASGWEFEGEEWYGSFSNDGDNSNDVPAYLGQYGSSTASWDGTAANNPFHLMVKSSGNHGDDNAPGLGATWYLNGSTPFLFDVLSHPKSDGDHYAKAGYGTVDSRGSAKNVLTVGSTSKALTDGVRDPGAAVLSAFSSAGPTDDGRIKPDLVGAGEDVYSVDGETTDRYLLASGTSMSSAGVAGSAQLLQEIYIGYKGKIMRSGTLKGLLIHTADDLELPGPDYRTGWGLANVQAAAELLYDDAASAPLDRIKQKQLNAGNPADAHMMFVDGSSPVRITLCWTDPAGSWTNSHDSRIRRLVNDLNVRLVSADGSVTHYPYVMPFTTTWDENDLDAPATTGVNTLDNVEQIYVEAPLPGLYRVEVDHAGSLQGDSQKYSLLVSGAYLDLESVEVVQPVADQGFLAEDASPLTVANTGVVFSGTGHEYTVTTTPEGILTATVEADGDVVVVPTLAGYGSVELTLTATDARGGVAETSFTVTLMPGIVRVDRDSTAPPAEQDGSSWDLAFEHLQDALEMAIPGQEIWVAEGVYFPDVRRTGDSNGRFESFLLPDGVGLYGGFTGTETARTLRNANSQATILSGDLWQDDDQRPIVMLLTPNNGDWNNCHHVVRVPSGNVATLDGFVVTAGKNTDFFDNGGAGIWVQPGAGLTVTNCLISGNDAAGNGGGLLSEDAVTNVVKCELVGNIAGGGGGALALSGSAQGVGSTKLSHCEIRGNQASDGGAMHLDRGNAWITDSLFSGNTGFFGGGGIHLNQGWFQMVNCTMTGHRTFGQGGAMQIVQSTGQPYIYNSVIWKNSAGGSEFTTGASAYGATPARRPYFENCLVANSGGSANWNWSIGWDGWNNIDADPKFAAGIAPAAAPSMEGDFRLTVNSPAINAGNTNSLFSDGFDLDGDGLVGEAVPIDLAGGERVVSSAVDLGAYEFGDLALLDTDNDGLSDEFENAHGGDLDPMSDDDGDGLTALAEFVHGLDPNAPLREPVGSYVLMDYLGTQYLCMTYRVNPDALNFVNLTIERRGDLASPLGWLEDKTIPVGTSQSATHPGMLEITCRSLVPFGQDRMEFLRIRHDIIPSENVTIPQSDPIGSTNVAGWNVWGW